MKKKKSKQSQSQSEPPKTSLASSKKMYDLDKAAKELRDALSLTEEEREQIFKETFPETAHLTPESSQKEREEAFSKLNKRLGIKDVTPQRYKLCSDDSGHEYFVPIDKVDEFYAWVEDVYTEKEYSVDFEDNRIDGRFTFTDPRNE